jgi:hypothetical protein
MNKNDKHIGNIINLNPPMNNEQNTNGSKLS